MRVIRTSLCGVTVLLFSGLGGCGNGALLSDTVPGPIGSVGDVTAPPDSSLPPPASVGRSAAKVYNEIDTRVLVTLRFLNAEGLTHVSLLEVLAQTATQIDAPASAARIHFSGASRTGKALPALETAYGLDFDEARPAVYRVRPEPPVVEEPEPTPGDGTDEPVDPKPPVDEEPPVVEEPAPALSIDVIEPAGDMRLALGSTLRVVWRDEAVAGAIVAIGLRSAAADDSAFVQLAPVVLADRDGSGDELRVTLQGFPTGLYHVVAVLDDGRSLIEAKAPGLIDVYEEATNKAPFIEITSPAAFAEVSVETGSALSIRWIDTDGDDDALITFSLVGSAFDAVVAGVSYDLSPPRREDGDGPAGDSGEFFLTGVLPGRYDLVATISDGKLSYTSRREGAVVVTAVPIVLPNVAPTIAVEAIGTKSIFGEGVFAVAWEDDDPDDNAMISFLLDPDFGAAAALDGNEVALASGIAEDPDGPAFDTAELAVDWETLPADANWQSAADPNNPDEVITFLDCRLVAQITDGRETFTQRVTGRVRVFAPPDEDTTPITDITVIEPARDFSLRPGQPLVVTLEGIESAAGMSAEYRLSNQAEGGSLTFVLPMVATGDRPSLSGPVAVATDLVVVTGPDEPRVFEVHVGLTTPDGVETYVAPGRICVQDGIEVIEVSHTDALCTAPTQGGGESASVLLGDGGGESSPIVEVAYRVGGCGNFEPLVVDLWITSDGRIPADGKDDAGHRMIRREIIATTQARSLRVLPHDLAGMTSGGYILVAVMGDANGAGEAQILTDGIAICSP
jgi:hypothetical protein